MVEEGSMSAMGKCSLFTDKADCIIRICKEKIPDEGEDSYCYSINEAGGMIGVFDGCGGSGARHYVGFQNRTGAYIASRAVCGAVKNWYEESDGIISAENQSDAIKNEIMDSIQLCKDHCGAASRGRIKGSISREFPTTAAIAICGIEESILSVHCYWAGDSRCYLLHKSGLAQLTEDDVDRIDALENISEDGTLQNVISASEDFELHAAEYRFEMPCIIIAATDGCFGYLRSPMHFEHLLLSKLQSANSIKEFEDELLFELDGISGDDYTLVAIPIGFGSYEELQKTFKNRLLFIKEHMIPYLETESGIAEIWTEYQKHYYQFRIAGETNVDVS